MERRVWVVEGKFQSDPGVWVPMMFVGLDRHYARFMARDFHEMNPSVPVRVRCYVPREAD